MFYDQFFVKPEPSKSVSVVAEEEKEESPELSLICVLIISKLVIQLCPICIIIITSRSLVCAQPGQPPER